LASTVAVTLIGNVQSGVATPMLNVIDTLDPLMLPLIVPLGPSPTNCVDVHVPARDASDCVSCNVKVPFGWQTPLKQD
jgi:hypothetical protein